MSRNKQQQKALPSRQTCGSCVPTTVRGCRCGCSLGRVSSRSGPCNSGQDWLITPRSMCAISQTSQTCNSRTEANRFGTIFGKYFLRPWDWGGMKVDPWFLSNKPHFGEVSGE
eukprot:1289317-Amphidinium_carterae.1